MAWQEPMKFHAIFGVFYGQLLLDLEHFRHGVQAELRREWERGPAAEGTPGFTTEAERINGFGFAPLYTEPFPCKPST